MLQLLETGQALYVLAGICVLSILTRAITRHHYKRLVKESTNLVQTKNKSLQRLRQKAENTYRMNQGMRNSGAWLEHQLYEMKAMGVALPVWSNLCQQWTWLCLLTGAAAAFLSYWYRFDTYYIVMYGGGAVLLSMMTMLFDSGTALGRREQLLASLQDQLENVIYPRLGRSHPAEGGWDSVSQERPGIRSAGGRSGRFVRGSKGSRAEVEAAAGSQAADVMDEERHASSINGKSGISSVKVEGGAGARKLRGGRSAQRGVTAASPEQPRGQEKVQESIRDIDYLKRSLEQIAASREKSRTADENWLRDLRPEEVELIGDILKQYLA